MISTCVMPAPQRLAPARGGERGELLAWSPRGWPRWSRGCRRPRRARPPSGRRTRRRGRPRTPGGCGCPRSRGSRSGPPASRRSSAAAPARLDRGHAPVLDHQRGVADEPERALAERRVAGDEQADVVDDERRSSARAPRAARAATSSAHVRAVAHDPAPADHDVAHVGRAPRRTPRTRRRARARVPARRTPSSETVARSASAPGSSRPAVGPAERRVAVRGRGAQQLAARGGGRARRWPAARRARSRAPPRTGRSRPASRCRRRAARRRRAAAARARCRRRGRARSSGTGSRSRRPRRAARRPSSVTCVAWTAVKRSRQRAGVGEQRGRRAAVRGQALLVLGRLLGDVRVQRPLRAPTRRRPRADSGSTARTLWIAAPTRAAGPLGSASTRSAQRRRRRRGSARCRRAGSRRRAA